ncbi:MAG: SufS family cysteine desulfurase [Bacteroidales bacterium]|nr:SufS family cysteine desulfurase [Bacteroidales bacterium]
MKVEDIRKMFPALDASVYGKPLVYFDNAATAQRMDKVLSLMGDLSAYHNANIHRAVHKLAGDATDAYEKTRDLVKEFLNASSREEIVFTSGTTASINLVAFCFGEAFIREGDEILVSEAEHHSNIVPWQLMCQRKKAVLKPVPVDDDGYLRLDVLENMISSRTKLVAITQISNVLGIINPVKEIVNICHSKGCKVLIDGAQGVVHSGIDVQDVDCDFYAFSGHKLYAATGTGVLYGKKELLEEMPPYMGGGEMIGTVSFKETTFAPLPEKFEAGTQNFNAVPTLGPAMEFARSVASDSEIVSYNEKVRDYLLEALLSDDRIRLFGVPHRTIDKAPVFSFAMKGVHHEDLALILDKMGIAVRSGQMCAEPVMDRFGVTGMLRASIAPYNTLEEAEYFIKSLEKAAAMLA